MRSFLKKHRIFSVILILFLILTSLGITLVAANWNQPLSDELELPTFAPTLTIETSDSLPVNGGEAQPRTSNPEDASNVTDSEISDTPVPQLLDEPTPKPLCGGPAVMTILGMGIDTNDDQYLYGLADVIRIIRVDFVTPKVTVLAFPRDLWVQIPEISDHYGIEEGKLNQSYFYGTKGMGYYEGSGEGPGLMALTLVKNFDLYVDRYISINMITLERVIDSVGGIDIYLPEAVNGRSDDGTIDLGFFPAGQQHLTGEAALRFSRIRWIDSDIGRIDRQTQVLYALQEKIQQPLIITRIPKLISSFQDSVITDFSPKDISALTCLIPKINRSTLYNTKLPDHLMTGGNQFDQHLNRETWVWFPNYQGIKELVNDFQQGIWPIE